MDVSFLWHSPSLTFEAHFSSNQTSSLGTWDTGSSGSHFTTTSMLPQREKIKRQCWESKSLTTYSPTSTHIHRCVVVVWRHQLLNWLRLRTKISYWISVMCTHKKIYYFNHINLLEVPIMNNECIHTATASMITKISKHYFYHYKIIITHVKFIIPYLLYHNSWSDFLLV